MVYFILFYPGATPTPEMLMLRDHYVWSSHIRIHSTVFHVYWSCLLWLSCATVLLKKIYRQSTIQINKPCPQENKTGLKQYKIQTINILPYPFNIRLRYNILLLRRCGIIRNYANSYKTLPNYSRLYLIILNCMKFRTNPIPVV